MNINLNPEQLLTVYNSLISSSTAEAQEVRNKLEAMILEALSNLDDSNNANKFSHWFKKEKQRVEALETELKSIKEPGADKFVHHLNDPYDNEIYASPVAKFGSRQ